MNEPDLSAIGSDIPPPKVTDLARREEKQFELECAKEANAHELRRKGQELGAVGRFFGTKENAVLYLVGFLVLLSVVLVGILIVTNPALHTTAIEILKVIIYAGIGFLTGKTLDPRKDQ